MLPKPDQTRLHSTLTVAGLRRRDNVGAAGPCSTRATSASLYEDQRQPTAKPKGIARRIGRDIRLAAGGCRKNEEICEILRNQYHVPPIVLPSPCTARWAVGSAGVPLAPGDMRRNALRYDMTAACRCCLLQNFTADHQIERGPQRNSQQPTAACGPLAFPWPRTPSTHVLADIFSCHATHALICRLRIVGA